MSSNLFDALKEVVGEKNLPMAVLVQAIEEALVVAYRKNFGADEDVKVTLDEKTGTFKVFSRHTVVADDALDDPDRQYTLEEAREIKPDAQIGDIIEEDVTPPSFGRIAAQTARQVVSQKLKEAERNLILREFQDRIGEVLSGKVQRVERGHIYVEFAKAEAVLPPKEQIPGEVYRTNDRIRCYVQEVRATPKGPQIVLSRASAKFVEKLFEQAVPEIKDGLVEIKSSSREPGSRVKIAVASKEDRVDPVGACVGLKGSRIKGIVDELNGEKIDIVRWSADPAVYVTNALSPAKVISVTVGDEGRSALAIVAPSQLSLAIGKEGQNVKLASKLTGIKIDIKTEQESQDIAGPPAQEPETE
ncbi:MAG: Transcription termination protein NusA [Candidatus Ozemobacter sibiricus]|uniref:Transcription termination/antitermination protein NusA n=1 Tax=Candidatus Ozemobacter sibiricus TaxID=2268124 RepID=A0A367ZU67_9BACT|nr:MAG: Transcription termination protein NusA [Candidatus Ozemobacter sibiricus]